MELSMLFDLEPHGPDTYVGTGPRYPWGGLYGGQIVAQALRAAAATVDPEFEPHSLRAYFIRRGYHTEPVRYEVDRTRNGRSFSTRRVVARQAIGVILNLEASFQRPEITADVETLARRVVAAERRALLYPRPTPTKKTAITGGTGFVGRHVAERFAHDQVVTISRRTGVDVENEDILAAAFEGCEVVVHSAGINREIGDQTFQRVHINGTRTVIAAAKRAGVKKIIMLSFLRARPDCGSPYHESKWAAEQHIRESGLDYTILKAGMIYGHGDHLVDHLSHTVATLPMFATVGFREKPIRPIPISDLVDIIIGATNGRMPHQTVSVTGAEQLLLSDAVRRVARVTGKRVRVLRAPVWAVYALAQLTEWTMKVPLIAKAQVRMLAEGVAEPWGEVSEVPEDLAPTLRFTDEQIRAALPEPGGFGWRDLRVGR